ncbi:divalent cation tolerance protein, CutA1 family [Ancylostoma ceylanicum]|uniref:Divalent cation tolerance protein, CutA1 family n=1 Tax=Ancylostoma ceylanicum TaxID=53326 RepID=A0A0D6L5N9_9BILA|nr:divalent cation tolerance protein, CutA1 family [Ancylostoma ceylanicum]
MRNLRVVYVTAPSKDAALKIASYEWQGKLHEDSEAVLIMKTQENLLEDLHKVVIENHSYEVPAFVSLPIDGVSQPYADWLLGQTKPSGNSEL